MDDLSEEDFHELNQLLENMTYDDILRLFSTKTSEGSGQNVADLPNQCPLRAHRIGLVLRQSAGHLRLREEHNEDQCSHTIAFHIRPSDDCLQHPVQCRPSDERGLAFWSLPVHRSAICSGEPSRLFDHVKWVMNIFNFVLDQNNRKNNTKFVRCKSG